MALKSSTVFSSLQDKILSGEWPENCRIPTEMELCSLYGVSRDTLRHALDRLVSLGLLRRTRGKGSFVTSRKVVVGETRDRGGRRIAYRYRLLLCERVPASPEDLRQLGGSESSSGWPNLWHLRRLQLKDGRPAALSDLFVAERVGSCLPAISRETGLSVFSVIGRSMGQRCFFSDGTLAVIVPPEDLCRTLGVPSGSANFWYRGVCKLEDGSVIGRCSTVLNGSLYEFPVDRDIAPIET